MHFLARNSIRIVEKKNFFSCEPRKSHLTPKLTYLIVFFLPDDALAFDGRGRVYEQAVGADLRVVGWEDELDAEEGGWEDRGAIRVHREDGLETGAC
jgi:hypothetical protein